MKKLILIILLFVAGSTYGQVSDPFFQSIVANVSYDSVLTNLQTFENFGVKTPGSTALSNTKNWLIAKYQSFGYTDIVSSNYTYSGNTLTNIVVTKTGNLYPNAYLIVDGHYDTKSGTGTNDNGSGVSIILEVARLLAGIDTKYSVRFINFSGEEVGLRGSQNYIDNIVVPQNMDILLVFNIDEVGGIAGVANNTIKCERDQSSFYPSTSSNNATSYLYTDTLVVLTGLYSGLNTVISNAYGSDYMPFEYNGEIITGYYENNESSVVHTANDNLAHLDTSYVYEIAKAACGATLYFAKAYDVTTSLLKEKPDENLIKIYPNPFTDRIFIKNSTENIENIKVFDLNGSLIFSFAVGIPSGQVSAQTEKAINLPQLNSGLYIFEISDDKGNILGRRKIAKM